MKAIRNCRIFTGTEFLDNCAIITENGIIQSICDENDAPDIDAYDCGGGIVTAGFIDLQVNGGGGALFNASPDKSTLTKIYTAHRKHGTAYICPTFITDSPEKLNTALNAVDEMSEDEIPAVHIEGFFISDEKRGIHSRKYISEPTEQNINKILCCGKRRKLITIAPEAVRDKAQIELFKKHNVIIFGGHTNASYEEFTEFIENGAAGATHLFNAMSGLSGRAPGVCGAVIDSKNAVAGIIADGKHVHYAMLRIAKRVMGERLFLVTDAMPPACSNLCEYTLYGNKIYVRDDVCVAENGTIAGSCLSMLKAVKNSVEYCDIALGEALRMASTYPARVLGRVDLGRLEQGCKACFTVVNESLTEAYVLGKREGI